MSNNPYAQFNQQIIDEFRANDGNVSSNGFGKNLILLHHLGAKSGTERVTPLMAIRTEQGTWWIAASKAGAPDNPDWYRNLLAHPDITIEEPGEGSVSVHVTELKGTARDAAWSQFTAMPAFKSYEEKTSRTIPVLELQRR
jgi:deazaflavin-dependent oxidoreductase (nitroreductase family)